MAQIATPDKISKFKLTHYRSQFQLGQNRVPDVSVVTLQAAVGPGGM